jgi:hypothetical protein
VGVLAGCGRSVGVGWFVLAMVVLLAGCDAKPPDRRPQVDRLTQQIRSMPGVHAASDDVADSPAQGLVYFHIRVEVADDITTDQLAALTSLYLYALPGAEDGGYQAELSVHAGWNVFRINSGKRPVSNGDQIAAQSRAWVAMRHEFAGATSRLRATITHPAGPLAIQEWGHSNVGLIDLPDSADYTAVAAAVTTLATRFPQLSSLDWTISAGNQHPADIKTLRRFPSAQELEVWNRINADQSITHVDKMTINGRVSAPVWISEETRSHDVNVALQLAHQHLPIVATLPAPVLYTASDAIQGHINGDGRATGPVAITVGGCTDRDSLLYKPAPAEQALINAYEQCRR